MQPRHRNIVVKRYELPRESPGGLLIPEAYRGDRTQTLWEVIAVGPCAAEPCMACRLWLKENEEEEWRGLGYSLARDDIIITVGWTAIELPGDNAEWIVDARHVKGVWIVGEPRVNARIEGAESEGGVRR